MKKIALITTCVLMTGCASQQGLMTQQVGQLKQDKTDHFVLWGLGQTIETDAAGVCNGADKVARTESHLSGLNALLGTVTLGLYSPRQSRVYCK